MNPVFRFPRLGFVNLGRSSDFPGRFAAFPSASRQTVAHSGKTLFSSGWNRKQGYSGGTAPDFNGIPY